jgi:hypothetical protein
MKEQNSKGYVYQHLPPINNIDCENHDNLNALEMGENLNHQSNANRRSVFKSALRKILKNWTLILSFTFILYFYYVYIFVRQIIISSSIYYRYYTRQIQD